MIRAAALGMVVALLGAGIARANDSVAELRPGGLVFIKNDDVVMASEDLFISMDEVLVDYVFRNTAENPVTVTVAFPMPAIEGNPWRVPSIPDADAANFLHFSVLVDEQPVTPKLQQRAEIAGIDVTDVLTNAGMPLEPFSQQTIEKIGELTEEAKRDFLRRGLLVVDSYDDDGTGMKDHFMPYWTLRTTYYWEMTFKPGAETRVSHRYTPSVGATVGLTFRHDAGQMEDYRRRYCMDDNFLQAVEKRIGGAGDETALYENRIAYVLTTGRNWAGNIGRFHLRVDKGSADNLVSFCSDGVKRTGPTTFEVVKDDYYPDRDLEVLILAPPQ